MLLLHQEAVFSSGTLGIIIIINVIIIIIIIIIQEVVLVRSSADERLGLTLCYEAEDHLGRTEIFVDDIHPAGLAERDGRLRLGDQIIQVYWCTHNNNSILRNELLASKHKLLSLFIFE